VPVVDPSAPEPTEFPVLFDHPYASFLADVAKPNRYTGAEFGVKRKDWNAVASRVCLAFPDIYDIGMSHLGYRILYKILNDHPQILAERAYTPWLDFIAELKKRSLPLASLESVKPLSAFDVVGFSLQFELTYTNVLLMLDLGGISLRSVDRGEDEPLILAGGPVATHAEPLAPFIDAILVGDGEEALVEMVLSWAEGRALGKTRRERLVDLSRIVGVYVPSLYEVAPDGDTGVHVVQRPAPGPSAAPFPIERRLVPDLDKYPFPDEFPIGGPEAIFDRMGIEIARGCTEGCRFCQAGMIYRPVRERDPEQVVSTILRALEKTGQDEVSLTALSTADVSCISPLIRRLVEKTAPDRVSLSVASLRAYGLSEELLDDMKKVRTSGLTFAPEAGTQRMRDVINKNVTEAQLMETAERVFSRGYDKMKLYFILGLPTETDEDVLGIADVGKNALAVGKRIGKRPTVTVSVSVHVPKPHTPFQWAAMDDSVEVDRKQRLLREAVLGPRVPGARPNKHRQLELKLHDSGTSALEGVLARGDRRLADVIERAYRAGAIFDSWSDQHQSEPWAEAFEHFGLETASFLGTIPLSARLPWDHIDVGLEDGFLAREYRKALDSRLSPPCGKPKGAFIHPTNLLESEKDARKLVCYDCGIACDLTNMKERRHDFLRGMGALLPGERARLPVIQEQKPAAKAAEPEAALAKGAAESRVEGDPPAEPKTTKPERVRHAPEMFRPPRPGSPPRRYRLHYQKSGPMALLGHLDFIRELPRVIRRALVRTAYTEGFHPKPNMSFTPALPLGAASIAEYVDISLIDAPEPAELLERLEKVAPPGLRFLGAAVIESDDLPISRVVDEARYVLGLPLGSLEGGSFEGGSLEGGSLEGAEGVQAQLDAFHAAGERIVWRNVDGIKRKIDAKGSVLGLGLGGDKARAALAQAGIVGRILPLELSLRVDGNGSVRPREVVEALGLPGPALVVRSELLGRGKPPLELEWHKKPVRPLGSLSPALTVGVRADLDEFDAPFLALEAFAPLEAELE
jgi:radical SAM family uncharacterized protein/radical SAM-linked protein